jgi:hypothetical protein
MPAVADDRLWSPPDVYFEAGDHEDLVHLSGEAFQKIQVHAHHGCFSREPDWAGCTPAGGIYPMGSRGRSASTGGRRRALRVDVVASSQNRRHGW